MQRLGRIIIPHNQAQTSALITRVRHRHALQQVHQSLSAGLQHDFHHAPELAAEDFRQAAMALGRITGDVDVTRLRDAVNAVARRHSILRTTYIVGMDGKLKTVLDKFKTKTHHDDLIATLDGLNLC